MALLPLFSQPKPRPPGSEPTAAQREELINRYKGGETLDALSKEIGRSDAWLRIRLSRWGVHIRNRSEAQLLRHQRKEGAGAARTVTAPTGTHRGASTS
ncbi:hypothetical protein SAMN05216371_3869 [Streptomyces sp. TLI_053]|nr:hypothetical protein SAMN05216371_3869 [Streptomyces sp. TLI_053]